jgi:UDP-GlcNAc:undecaprenyl-phosphate GlcNAc-1-phosphate transferase
VPRYLTGFGFALLLSVLFTRVVRAGARRAGLIAHPRADRWHSRPTALFGGIGIYAGFMVTYLLETLLGGGRHDDRVLVLLGCATWMFVLGLVDDRFRIKPHTKLIFQIIGAALFTRYGLRLHWLPSDLLDEGLTIFWLVGVTNALNLLDNIDGLAGGVAAIGSLFLVYLCHTADQPEYGTLAATFAGAICGFLFYNFNPASIFMGDCGSLFLGFFLAGIALINTQPGGRRNLLAVLVVPVLLLLLPILDTTLVTITRKFAGRPISVGGRDHTSHRLVALGLSESTATLTLWSIAALSGSVAVLVRNLEFFIGFALVALLSIGLVFVMVFLGQVQVYEPVVDDEKVRGMTLLPTLADFGYKRRVFEVTTDLVIILFSYYVAFLLRFEGGLPEPFYGQFLKSVPVLLCVQIGALLFSGLYRGMWRYTGVADLILQVRAVFTAVCFSALLVLVEFRFEGFSRAVFAIDGMLLLLCISGSRLSFRLMHAWVARRRRHDGARRVLIYGAGDRGELVLREIQNNPHLKMVPVGFVDDDPQKHGRVIYGLRVLGPASELTALLYEERIEEVVISTGRLDDAKITYVEHVCLQMGAPIRQMRVTLD